MLDTPKDLQLIIMLSSRVYMLSQLPTMVGMATTPLQAPTPVAMGTMLFQAPTWVVMATTNSSTFLDSGRTCGLRIGAGIGAEHQQ